MRRYFLAEKMKYRHTTIGGVTFFMPLLCVFLSAWLTHSYFAVDSYNWWYVVVYPGVVGILCGMLGNKEKRKNNHTVWPLPCSMGKIWDAKILVGAMLSGVSVSCIVALTILAGKGMEAGLHMEFFAAPSIKEQMFAGVLIWLTTLWEIPFCLFLVQKMGTFLMVILHLGTYIAAAAVVSLQSWFVLLPGAITARIMCPVLKVMPNGLLLQPGQMTYSEQLAGTWVLPAGILASLLWFGLLWAGTRKWFERQVSVK